MLFIVTVFSFCRKRNEGSERLSSMLRSMHLENERTVIQPRVFYTESRAPFTSCKVSPHDENWIVCDMVGPKIVTAKNTHFAYSSLSTDCLLPHSIITYAYVIVFLLAYAKKIKAEPDSPWSQWYSTHVHWINIEQSGTGLYPVLCNSYLHQHAISLLFCVSQSSSYKNKFSHLSLFPKCLMWFINLYLSSLTHLERSTSSPTDVNKEEGGNRHLIIYQETSMDTLKILNANYVFWLNK